MGQQPNPASLHRALERRGWSLATAESLTGGRLAARLTETPGASRSFAGGVVAYATEVKVSLLGVPEELVARAGVVSAECAAAMAAGVRRVLGADVGVATTGVAGPDPQDGLPPGTVFVAVVTPDRTDAAALELAGGRSQIMERTVAEALRLLDRVLQPESPALR